MRRKLVAGNWKMNGSLESIRALVAALKQGVGAGLSKVEVAVFPPYVYIPEVSGLLSGSEIAYGAQNISKSLSGAYTGEVSATMLNDFGCKYTIIGHSERRTIYGELDYKVELKFAAAKECGIIPILCVGETLEEFEAGRTQEIVSKQLQAVIDRVGVSGLDDAVIAYEPVWAIGTGKTASPAQAQSVHKFIRDHIAAHNAVIAEKIVILYGGSLKAANASELFAQPDIDGGLIGGASLDASEFISICQAADRAG